MARPQRCALLAARLGAQAVDSTTARAAARSAAAAACLPWWWRSHGGAAHATAAEAPSELSSTAQARGAGAAAAHPHEERGAPAAAAAGGGGATGDAAAAIAPAAAANTASATRRPSAVTAAAAARALKVLGRRRPAADASSTAAAASATAASASAAGASAALEAAPLPGLLAVLGATAGVVRGLGAVGVGAATFGLQALARRHEEQRVEDHPGGGRRLQPGPAVEAEAERLLDALELAHGAYRGSAAALAATTCLRAQHVHAWRPQGGRLQPGYFVAVDPPGRRVVWGVRGTRVFNDLLTDLAMAPHPLGPGEAHWGMTHAANWLLQQEGPRVAGLLRALRGVDPRYRLELVGHSMGGAVAALAAVMLRHGVAGAAAIPDDVPITCTAFAAPAVMSPPLAAACRPYVTTVVLHRDIVPRLNAASLALLREELQDVDWFAELQRTLMEHSVVKGVSSTLTSLTRAAPASAAGPALPARRGDEAVAASPSRPGEGPWLSAVPTALQPQASAAAVAAQQLSAAVLESAAFRSAVQALDDWRARLPPPAGGASERATAVAAPTPAEVVRDWLQELAGQGKVEGSGADVVRRAADAAAEGLRRNVDAAAAAVAAAAVASQDRLSASLPSLPALPSLPSLPQPHELPLVEAAAAAAAAAATAAQQGPMPRDGDPTAGGGGGIGGGLVIQQPQELPHMLPPGRILYIRPSPSEVVAHSQLTASGTASDGSPGHTGAAVPPYVIEELPPGTGFARIVLGRAALEEHQCRAYRRVLMQLALHVA